MIKNHLHYAALGAVGGALISVVVDKAFDRRAAGKPAIPSGLIAAVSGLLPLASVVLKDLAQQVDAIVDGIHGGDGGDSAGSGENDEPVTGGPSKPMFTHQVRDADLTGQGDEAGVPAGKAALELETA